MIESVPKELADFVREYERRTNSHDFAQVSELIDPNAIYWFSDGTHEGIDEIERAFDQTWDTIRNEVYTIEDVKWLSVDETSASCVYPFHWEGEVEGEPESGSGRGTSIFVKKAGDWKVVHEHLST